MTILGDSYAKCGRTIRSVRRPSKLVVDVLASEEVHCHRQTLQSRLRDHEAGGCVLSQSYTKYNCFHRYRTHFAAQAADCEVGAVATGHVHSRNRGSRVRNLLLSTTPEFLTSSLFSSNSNLLWDVFYDAAFTTPKLMIFFNRFWSTYPLSPSLSLALSLLDAIYFQVLKRLMSRLCRQFWAYLDTEKRESM